MIHSGANMAAARKSRPGLVSFLKDKLEAQY